MKTAPVMAILDRWPDVLQTLVDTRQYCDRNMTDAFFFPAQQLAVDVNLEAGSSSHACRLPK
jgi:hypothetical protein